MGAPSLAKRPDAAPPALAQAPALAQVAASALADPGSAAAPAADPFDGAPAPTDTSIASSSAATPAGGLPADTGPNAALGVEPTIQYQDALAHQDDRIAFTPGGRVDVPFTPRADDGWFIDGQAPAALPAGSATGRAMADAPQGSTTGSVSDSPGGPRLAAIPAVATAQADTTAAARTPAGLRRQVFGFLPYWTLSDSSTVLDYNLLSTIAYFSVGADRSGNLLKKNANGSTTSGWGGWTSSKLTNVINAAHRHHTRVVLTISVMAWSSGQAALQAALLGDPAARLNLARQAAAAVRSRGADGINLDFEPIADGHSTDFTKLVRTMRAQLDRIHRGYQLTFDTTGMIGNYPIEDATAKGGADAIFIMGYDYRTSDATTAGSIDPLDGPGYTLVDTIKAYTARVPPSKLILGLPYYGRAWSTTASTVGADNRSSAKYGTSTSVLYDTAAALVRVYGRNYDPVQQVAWFTYKKTTCTTTYGCVTSARQVYFDDAQALKARYDLIVRSGLRGAGIWALGFEGKRPELYGALSLKFLHDTTAPETGVSILPSTTTDAGFIVRWSAQDDSRIASYDVQASVDGGPWSAWLTRSHQTSEVYLGADGHGYAFRARATDALGNVGSWDITSNYDASPTLGVGGFGRVAVDGVAARVAPDTSSLKVATLSAGGILAIIGGPVSADGFTWYQVTGPLAAWDTVGFTRSGVWVAARDASTRYVAAARAPNSTLVNAAIDGLTFGKTGTASLGVADAALAARAFSPNGDGSEDQLRIRWTNHLAFDTMTLVALRTDGTVIGTRSLPDIALGAQLYDWDGTVSSGRSVPDGRYVLQLVGRVGSTEYHAPSARPTTPAQVVLYAVTVDRVAPVATSFSSSGTGISPDGDGRFDALTFRLAATGGQSWDLAVARLTGKTAGPALRTIVGAGTRAALTWNGTADDGTPVPDGAYRVTMRIADAAGNHAIHSWTIKVDARDPAITSVLTPTTFSPNGDGASDTTTDLWSSDKVVSGAVTVRRGGTVIRRWGFSAGSGGTVHWDGRTASGAIAADGNYTIRVDGMDATGNRVVVDRSVIVDRTIGFLRWSASQFDPQDGDTLAATSRVSVKMTRTATVTLSLYDASGALVRTVWTGRSFPAGTASWTWDGKTDLGAYAAPGSYTAVLTATSSRGTSTLRRSIFAGAFVLTPSATKLHAGQTLTVTIGSVEPLAKAPVGSFAQHGHSLAVKTATALGGGRYRITFLVRSGGLGAATITVTGRDSLGHTNRATLGLVVS